MNNWIEREAIGKFRKTDHVVDKIGRIRGIDDIWEFISPTSDNLIDPHLMKNIVIASERIKKAIDNDENICISYDNDADGITAGTIANRHLSKYTDKISYIYGQRSHGHGIHQQIRTDYDNLSEDRVKFNKENLEKVLDSDLLIIVDSSTNDVEACRFLNEQGVDVIILDHHSVEVDNPHAIIVNPQQKDCEYPNKHLSGAGIVFKTMEVLESLTGSNNDVWEYIDLVAVGMYADVMRIDVMENRYMIMHGLRNMKNVGLVRILKGAKADLYKLNGDSIGFSIAPMLNGVSRLDEIELAIEILLTDDDTVAKKLRLKMSKLNEKRKEIQASLMNKYSEDLDTSKKAIMAFDTTESSGFNGLVAQNMLSKYKKPALVGRIHNGEISGSCRSYDGLDMKQIMEESGLMNDLGGHNYAFGYSFSEDNLEKLEEYLDKVLPEAEDVKISYVYDLEMTSDEVDEYIRDIQSINLLTGNGFEKVKVKISKLSVDDVAIIGKTQETCKIKTFEEIDLLKFRVNEDYASGLGVFDEITAVGDIQVNEYYNFGLKELVITNQMLIEDYQEL